MRKKLHVYGFLISSAVLSASSLRAQAPSSEKPAADKPKYNTWSVTAGFGSALMYGDTRVYDLYPVKNNHVNERKMGFGFTLNKQINDRFAVHGNLLFGKLAGAKLNINPATGKREYTYVGSTISETSFFEYTLLGSANLTGMMFKTSEWTKKFSVSGYAGLGLVRFRSIAKEISADKIVYAIGYEGFEQGGAVASATKKDATSEVVIPMGLWLNYKINKRIAVGMDLSLRNVYSDKLDAINKAGTSNDKYSYAAVNVTYTFGKAEKDLQWLEPEEKLAVEGILPDMKKYDDKLTEVDKKLEELNAKNAELDKKLEDLNSKTDELNKKAEELNKKAEEKAKETGSSGAAPKSGTSSTGKETNVTDFFAIEFEANSAILKKDSYKDLKLLAEVLTQNPKCELKVDGHTDVTGSPALNFKLSQQRANAVKDYLIKTGVPNAVRIKTEAWGEKKPVAANDTDEGKAKNRRVELTVRCDEK